MARMKMEKLGQQDSNSFESENGDIDTDALLAQLQLKDDSLTDLHVEVAQLRDQIERLDLSTDTNDKNLRHQKGRGLQDVDQMKDDLIKYQIAERTLKGLLQHTTSLLNAQLLKKTSTNSDSSNDAVTNIQKDLDKAKARIVDLTNEISKLRDDLSVSQQNEKKLTVSLNEAVDLLKPLQTQIEKAEKDKKDLQIRLSEAQSTLEVRNLGHDIDYVTGRTNKGEYEKTIDQLNQYVGELEAEVTKLEGKVLVLNESSMKDDKRIRLLEAEITDLRGKYESTRIMLDDVTETNRSLLNDLRQSEAEELEVIEEFSEAQDMLRVAQEEIENAKFVASSLISKMDEINFRDNASSASARSTASGKMRTLTACFHALEEQVRLAAERNMALENQLSIKNRLISDMMGKRR
jgi:chromosome segregation ATPase